ncbi:2OG-Fe dioxygenase family protein [Streptomyces sp. 4N509B]|uniref:2OG-Fe dioxygenase family protein n=1 Tax=Streptomyces sp. 4N509B TaxID=3457413 RepID=UPI003FCF353A
MLSIPHGSDEVGHLREWGFMTMTAKTLGIADGELISLQQLYDNELDRDEWLPEGKGYRLRGYQCFDVDPSNLATTHVTEPPPYFQPVAVNHVAGGIQRRFRAVPWDYPTSHTVAALISVFLYSVRAAGLLDSRRKSPLALDAHYVRITAPGRPAPEGIHRDGIIAGAVHLVRRVNIMGGTTSLFDSSENRICDFVLDAPLDSFIFDDSRLLHYTDEVRPAQPDGPAYRDVLLLGVR